MHQYLKFHSEIYCFRQTGLLGLKKSDDSHLLSIERVHVPFGRLGMLLVTSTIAKVHLPVIEHLIPDILTVSAV